MLLLAGIALAVLLRKTLGRIALLLLVSGTLAYLLDPLSRFYRRHTRLAQGPCAALAFASAALALAAFLFFGVPALSRQLTALAQAAPQLVESFGEQLTRMTASLGRVGLPDEAVTVLRAQGEVTRLYLIAFVFAVPVAMLLVNFSGLSGAVVGSLVVMSILLLLLVTEYLAIRKRLE